MFHPTVTGVTEKILTDPDYELSGEVSCELVRLSEMHFMDVMACADKIRNRYHKNRIFTCAITNAKSGFCSEDCAFCAQSSHHHTDIHTYPMVSEEFLIESAVSRQRDGAVKFGMVTSGYANTVEEMARICRTAASIRTQTPLGVCASLGMLKVSTAVQLKNGGVTRYHHNLETARSYFSAVCTTHDYEEDVETVRIAKNAGLEVCSGGIMGLGESWEQRIELSLTLRELDVDSIPINFLNPISGTRMENRAPLSPQEALRCIALFRFMHPQKDIVICGGRGVTLGDFQSWIFMAGANGLMIGDYLTTQGRDARMDMEMIQAIGLEIHTRR